MTMIRTKPSEMRFQGLFDSLFSPESNVLDRSGFSAPGLNFPKVNIKEDNDGYYLELAVPGCSKEDFKINLDKDILTVSSEKKEEVDKELRDYKRLEFSYQSFERRFNLPEDVEGEQITADYLNGVLAIHIPKVEAAKPKPPKTIEIR